MASRRFVLDITILEMRLTYVCDSGRYKFDSPSLSIDNEIRRTFQYKQKFANMQFRGSYRKHEAQYIPLIKATITVRSHEKNTVFELHRVLLNIKDAPVLLSVVLSGAEQFNHTECDDDVTFSFKHYPSEPDRIEALKNFGAWNPIARLRNEHGARKSEVADVFSSKRVDCDRPTYAYGTYAVLGVAMLYTVGDARIFMCPLTLPQIAIRILSAARKFNCMQKLMKMIDSQTKPFRAEFAFSLWPRKDSHRADVIIQHDMTPSRGTMTVIYSNCRGTQLKSYKVSIRHLIGVFNRRASLSYEANFQARRDWDDRFMCPHAENCPRECGVLTSGNASTSQCTCGKVVSKYHYKIENGGQCKRELGGFMQDLIDMHSQHPHMFAYSPIAKLMKCTDTLRCIESFIY